MTPIAGRSKTDRLTLAAVGVSWAAAGRVAVWTGLASTWGDAIPSEGDPIMDTDRRDPAAVPGAARRLSRRRVLRQGGAGLAAVLAPDLTRVAAQEATPVGEATPPVGSDTVLSDAALGQLEADIEAALGTFNMVGAAVALVDRSGIRYGRGFGVRDLASDAPVTPETHFLVASTTKSMSSLLVATLVDDGALAWDQPVREVWPDFRAPSDALTRELRIRDLFGMASGIGEPASTVLHFGDLTAGELLRSIVELPVDNPPNVQFFYNNTLYAAGGYLPALQQKTAPEELETTYARLMAERVYRPAGMTDARTASDPRPFVADYATGHAPDFVHGTAAEPYAPLGSYAPAGGTMANLTSMANYVAMQLRRGVAVDGTRVVSEANLAE